MASLTIRNQDNNLKSQLRQRTARHGRSMEDAQIASIAVTHGYPLAKRNIKDFLQIDGLTLYDPWKI